jgi:MFS family permease
MSVESLTSLRTAAVQVPVVLVSLGHGATHWILATFYLLIPFITKDLELTYVQAGFLVTCLQLSSAAANLPSGTVVDLTGRRVLVQVVALSVGSVALMAIGVAHSFFWLSVIAAVIGATNMLWHPAAISFLSGHLPNNRGYALSIHGLGANLGDALAPLAAGWMLLTMSWPTTASLNAVVGFATAALLLTALRQSDHGARKAAAALDLRLYARGLWRTARQTAVWSLCLMSGFRTMMQIGLMVFLPLFLSHELGLNPFWMGVALMLMQVGGMVATPIAGTLSDRVGRRPIVVGGMMGTSTLVIALSFIDQPMLYVAVVSVLGFFMYAMRPVIQSWVMDRSPPHLAATMTSLLFGTQSVMGAATPLIGGWVADLYGLKAVFYFLAAMILVANVLALLVPKSEKGD